MLVGNEGNQPFIMKLITTLSVLSLSSLVAFIATLALGAGMFAAFGLTVGLLAVTTLLSDYAPARRSSLVAVKSAATERLPMAA